MLLCHVSGIVDQNLELAYVCDVDSDRLAKAAKWGKSPQAVSDLRKILDDKNVDAVVVATPDHWHSPAAILACDAGKHVYCEKPCSHNLREGRMLVDAARRNKRVVQHGTQVRSTPMMIEAVQKLQDKGGRQIGVTSRVGGKWMASVSNPATAVEAQVEALGFKHMITGETREAVELKLRELVDRGARLVQEPELSDGVWTAVCEKF